MAGGRLAGKITALDCQKKAKERISVFLDGRFAFGLPAIVAARLRLGQTLTEAEIQALRDLGDLEETFNSALDFLSYRPRSRAEMIRHMQKKAVPDEQIEAVADRLEQAGLLGDEAFAQFWVENRERFRPRGPAALRYELRSKGVGEEAIRGAMETLDASDSAYRAASSKARHLSHLDQATFHRKLVEFLLRRGFAYDTARETAQRHWAELADHA
jgi:regulatory protein